MKYIVLTACCVDFYPQLNKSFLGGNSLNFSNSLKNFNKMLNVSVLSSLGDDENGLRIKKFLDKIQVNTSFVKIIKNGKTPTNHLINNNEGERFGVEGSWNGGVYDNFFLNKNELEFLLQHDVICIPANNPNFKAVIDIKKNNVQKKIVVDFLDKENKINIEETIRFTDIAFITATKNDFNYYKNLAEETGALLILTMGVDGSFVFFNGKIFRQEAIKVDKVIDTTGCGDSYLGAFTASYFLNNDIQKAMLAGALSASKTLKHFGGVIE